jgi:pimeloyl-ACP methyl ester carboxylesterase
MGIFGAALLGLTVSTMTVPAHAAPAEEPPISVSAVTWTSCTYAPGAQCAFLNVPKDWRAPANSGTYRIGIARVRASDPARRLGVLMFNPGGPGTRAVGNLSWVLSLLPAVVKQRFDIVAVDPRGVGTSQPSITTCSAPQPTPPATGVINWQSWTTTFMAANRKANRECLRINRQHADTVNTWQVVRDVDAVRDALGEKRITFWGMSYGSTVGRAYAQTFPSRVRALLLDGAISPQSSIELWAREHTWDDALAISTMLRSFGPQTEATYNRAMSALDRRTLTAANGRVITRWTVGRAMVAWSSFHTTWGSARSLITHLNTALFDRQTSRRSAGLASLANILSGTFDTGQPNYLDPQWRFVNCADFHDRPGVSALARMAEVAARDGGVGAGMAVIREGAQCAGLPPLGRALTAINAPVSLRTPPLIANAVADNRTPWTAAQSMAQAFTGSRIIGYQGTHHILYGRRTACVNDPITRYLVQRTIPSANVMCPR